MVYESSYESGMMPFRPDTMRGYWAHPSDFIYACWSLAFQMDIFSMKWYFFFEMGIYSILPHLICMALFVVPIVLIQSFLGQFSSSGYISAFRLSPIFKGMGYISLAVNFSVLTYYSIFAAIPLIYFFHSLRPTLPWSCEAFREWGLDAFQEWGHEGDKHTCEDDSNTTTAMSILITSGRVSELNTTDFYRTHHIPSVLFFRSLFANYSFGTNDDSERSLSFAWQLLLCMLLVWAAVALIFHYIKTIEQMGKLIRYAMWLLMVLMLVCGIRLIFLKHATTALVEYFLPQHSNFLLSLGSIPVIAIAAFGTGWGAIISLASYNQFKTNIMRFSWFICVGQLVIMVLFGLITFLIDRHFGELTNNTFYENIEQHWILFLSSGSALATMELANMWSLLFYGMLVISSLLIILTQLLALLTAIFDDFEHLRMRKQELTFGLIGLLALCSIYFCSNHGLTYFSALPADALFTQIALNLLLLLVVLWVYGRVRFQRDIEFMLGQRFATWRVYVLRFVAPLFLLIALLMAFVIAYYEHYLSSLVFGIVAIFLIGIPWLFIPGYVILRIFQTSGSISMRFRRCCRPTDWYPVDPEERQRYEEAMGNMDITHQLNEVGNEEVF